LLTAVPTNRFFVSARDLVDAFYRLSPVAALDRDILVQIERGGRHGPKMYFEARAATGFGRTEIETRLTDRDVESTSGFEMKFVLASLARGVVLGPAWVETAIYDPKAMIMTQEHDGSKYRMYVAAR
jgi:hypothetical protein